MWKVGGKVFAIGGWERESNKPAFTFKTSTQNYYFLCQCLGYRPAPYFASRGMKWIQLYEGTSEEKENLRYYIEQSHKIVSLGLTRQVQKELGLNQE